MESSGYDVLAVRIAEIMCSPAEAQDWLQRSTVAFGGQRPVDLLKTTEGRHLIEEYLRDLEIYRNAEAMHLGPIERDANFGHLR